MAADAYDACASIIRRAKFCVLCATHFDDVLDRAKRLDVVHNGGAHIEPQNCWKIRRFDTRIAAFAFKGFDQARLFAADVCSRASMHVDFQIISAAQDVLSKKAFRTRLGQGAIQNFGAVNKFTANVDIGQMNIIRVAPNNHPFEHLVRVLVNNLAILECAWLRFVRIANQVNGLAALAVHERPFQAA